MIHFNELMTHIALSSESGDVCHYEHPKFTIEYDCGHVILEFSLGSKKISEPISSKDLHTIPNIIPDSMNRLAELMIKELSKTS